MTPTQAKMCVCVCVFKYRAGKSSGSTDIYVSVHVPPLSFHLFVRAPNIKNFFFFHI